MEKINTLNVESYVFTDPLIINLDSNVTSVSNEKFFFDLDADGKEEEISFAGKGSGFLAFDKNGDGFADLAKYDEDGNGWIDENDSIFSKLKVWTRDEDGTDHLLDLKQADVGAIYLKSANTQFSLNNDENVTNGILRKTGIYLKESTGEAKTLAHVDLAI